MRDTSASYWQKFSKVRLNTFLNRKPALGSGTLQHTATHCNTLQHTLFSRTERMHRPISKSALHFDIKNIEQIRNSYGKQNASARRFLPATLPECWPQVCRVKIMFELLRNNFLVSTKMNSMKCFVNWIPANTHDRSNKTKLCFNSHFMRKFSCKRTIEIFDLPLFRVKRLRELPDLLLPLAALLQCVAVCCSVLQCVAVCHSVLRRKPLAAYAYIY